MQQTFKLFLIFLLLAVLQIADSHKAQAAIDKKNYGFQFQPFNGETYTFETQSGDADEAYEKAATSCFQHFKKGRRISMDQGLDIIDICANPRRL